VIPFEMLSASNWKEATLDYFGKSWTNYRPTAAIQQPFLQQRKELHAQRSGNAKTKEEFRDLEDVRLCMTAIGPCAPLWLGSWIQAEDWVPNLTNMALLPERLNAGNYPRSVGEDWRELYSLHERWVVLKTKEKSCLRVALSRINSALRYSDLVQASIDLGIAMDALFLFGTAADRGEAGLTLRLRAARFLGKDPQSRSEISDLFSALYLLRNIAVHAGVVGDRVKSPASKSRREYDTQDLLNDGFYWAGKAIRRIIREGEPDWLSIILE
jgi:Apea-like HEPN